jgi:hypothetical protein
MSHGHAPHEEAEHAAHHSQGPFDRRVAMTMVAVAALLAGVKVLGHRTHNETLGYQIEAGVYHSKANVQHTQESDQWNFYQAKKMRQHLYESQSELLASLAPADKGTDPAVQKKLEAWGKQAKRYRTETNEIKKKAEEHHKAAKKDEEKAGQYQEKSEHKHHQSAFFDLGELGVELALVLCSVAILTKRPPFWYGGMAVCAVGLVVVLAGFFVH